MNLLFSEQILKIIEVFPRILREIIAKRPGTVKKVNQLATRVTDQKDLEVAYKTIANDNTYLIEFYKLLASYEIKLRQNAYKYQLKTEQSARYKKSVAMTIIAALGIGSCMAVISFAKGVLSEEAINLIHTTAGIFGACLKDVFAFEFGGFISSTHDAASHHQTRNESIMKQPSLQKTDTERIPTVQKMIKDR